ncbi:MAG: TRAP transporter substrate-binding protein [Pseudomonas sp.]
MNRRPFGLIAALLACLALAACGYPDEPTHWRLLSTSAQHSAATERLAERVATLSGGRLRLDIQAQAPQQAFAAVSAGQAELVLGSAPDWQTQVPAAQFFGAVPFGLSTAEMHAWLSQGGGQQLWDEAYAPFGIKPLAAGDAGLQMGGWYNTEINALADLEGLKIRMPGLGGAVLKRLAASTLDLPEGELFSTLQSNAIDATAGGSPFNDLASGLHRVAKFYYYPGWQAPQALSTLLVNQQAYAALPADLQAIVTEAARAASQDLQNDYLYHNALALEELKRQGVQLKRFPDEVLTALQRESELVLGELAAQSELNGRIWASMKAFQAQVGQMQRLSEQAPYDGR